jgi:hypothetical protein
MLRSTSNAIGVRSSCRGIAPRGKVALKVSAVAAPDQAAAGAKAPAVPAGAWRGT